MAHADARTLAEAGGAHNAASLLHSTISRQIGAVAASKLVSLRELQHARALAF
ncbi:hypothetical protein MHZ93_19910 [Roseomonas sp. ACRSG]|nr:hypothetical protein [Roseomonas sp. ACRSG]